MQAGDSHVVDLLHLVPHELCGENRLGRHGDVRGAGADDEYLALPAPLHRVLLDGERARVGVVDRLGEELHELRPLGAVHPRREDVAAFFEQRLDDGAHLWDALALSEDDFREALAQRAVVVHRSAAQVLEGEVLQLLQGVRNVYRSLSHVLEYLLDCLTLHESGTASAGGKIALRLA